MSEDNSRNHDSSATHQRLQHSTTLNRRYVTRPEPLVRPESTSTRIEIKIEGPDDIGHHESPETAEAIAISSFAQSQAENLRRRQELADKINKERALARQSKTARRAYVAITTPAQEQEFTTEAQSSIAQEQTFTTEEQEFTPEASESTPEEQEFTSEEQDTFAQEQPFDAESQDTFTQERTFPACDQAPIAPEQPFAQARPDIASQQSLAASIQVAASDDSPAGDWDTEEEDWSDEDELLQDEMVPAPELPIQRAANARLAQTWSAPSPTPRPTAQELKDAAIRKAMHSVATMEAAEQKSEQQRWHKQERRRMNVCSRKRIALAIACAVAVVGTIGYLVVTNMPSVSYGAMAMQSGIDLSKMWVPRDFNLITSSAGEGSLSVVYAKGEDQFSLSAELSSWDSQALLNNYVTTNWRSYDAVKEQGKTIYISGSNAAWVSGGVRYILECKTGTLTNKQIKSIATSL